MKRLPLSLLVALVLAGCGGAPAMAQQPGPDGQPPRRPPRPPRPPQPPEPPQPPRPPEDSREHRELRKHIQALRMARLTQELDLDEAGAAKLFPLLNRHDEKVTGFAEQRGQAM